MTLAIETTALGLRYRHRWALRDCDLAVPTGHVIGLVGPNGAGKSTLLHLAVGLLTPTTGRVSILGGPPVREHPDQLARVGFVAQDKPLYGSFRVEEMLRFGGWLNPGWDADLAAQRLRAVGVPLKQRVGRLSGGERAQVALALALGKRPELLLLDEPVANLDPLARREFLQVVMAEVASTGLTVLLSSHLVADLERVCDYLVLLSASRVQLAGETQQLLREHALLTGPRDRATAVTATQTVVQASHTDRQASLLVHLNRPILDPAWTVRPVGLEELVLAYMRQSDSGTPPRSAGPTRSAQVPA